MEKIIIFYFTESLYPVKTKWIVADFSQGEKVYKHIERQLAGIPVGILGKQYTNAPVLGAILLWYDTCPVLELNMTGCCCTRA